MTNGLYRAFVSNVNDPDKMGRIKAIIPELLGDESESAWCMPCVPVCYDDGGDFCLPKLKETVWIAFEGGDIDSPVYLGNWWSPESVPTQGEYDKDTRIISFDECAIIMKKDSVNIVGKVNLKSLSINGKSLKNYIKEVVEEMNNA